MPGDEVTVLEAARIGRRGAIIARGRRRRPLMFCHKPSPRGHWASANQKRRGATAAVEAASVILHETHGPAPGRQTATARICLLACLHATSAAFGSSPAKRSRGRCRPRRSMSDLSECWGLSATIDNDVSALGVARGCRVVTQWLCLSGPDGLLAHGRTSLNSGYSFCCGDS